jgi:uncharacterized protein (TIGR04222 family)
MNTWGISGGAFLGIYGAAIAATGMLVYAIVRSIRGQSDRSGLAGTGSPDLTPYELAMLKEGDSLVLTVATCRLTGTHSLKIDDKGKGLVVAGPLPSPSDRVESWVYGTVLETPGIGKHIIDKRAAEPVLAPIRERLRGLGLMLQSRQRTLIRCQLAWFLPIIGLGVARAIAGSHNHKPVGFLWMMMLGAVCLAWVVTKPPITTLAGDRALDHASDDPAALSSFGSAAEVALTGTAALFAADAVLASTLGVRQGGGSFGGGGGGCGGGGCGGGCGG